jgi:hypothetical protein
LEYLLNLVWALLAIAIACLWPRFGRHASRSSRQSFIAIAVLIAVLFPVISVRDDFYAMNNPAEIDTCQRRVHSAYCPHSIIPVVAALPVLAPAERSFGLQRSVLLPSLTLLSVYSPALETIRSRPPPLAL